MKVLNDMTSNFDLLMFSLSYLKKITLLPYTHTPRHHHTHIHNHTRQIFPFPNMREYRLFPIKYCFHINQKERSCTTKHEEICQRLSNLSTASINTKNLKTKVVSNSLFSSNVCVASLLRSCNGDDDLEHRHRYNFTCDIYQNI